MNGRKQVPNHSLSEMPQLIKDGRLSEAESSLVPLADAPTAIKKRVDALYDSIT